MITDIQTRRDQLAQTICQALRVTIEDLKGRSKAREVYNARCVYSYLARHVMGDTYQVIGRFLNKDHHSVINQIEAMNDMIYTKHASALIMKQIESELVIENAKAA